MSFGNPLQVPSRAATYLKALRLAVRPGQDIVTARLSLPSLLADAEIGDPAALRDAAGWIAERPKRTSTDVAIITFRGTGGAPVALFKLAQSAQAGQSLTRQQANLRALIANPRLETITQLLPRQLAHGHVHGHFYVLEGWLGGYGGDRHPRAQHTELIIQAAGFLRVLHGQTASDVVVSEQHVHRWVTTPLDSLRALGAGRIGRVYEAQFDRLCDDVRIALIGNPISTAWIHGDYWLGNVLATEAGQLSGVVDWDQAASDELPLHDVLHVLLYRRRLLERRQLGRVICETLNGRPWDELEQGVLGRYSDADDVLQSHVRVAVLLYWLRYVATYAPMSDHGGNAHWVRRNVESVLRRL